MDVDPYNIGIQMKLDELTLGPNIYDDTKLKKTCMST